MIHGRLGALRKFIGPAVLLAFMYRDASAGLAFSHGVIATAPPPVAASVGPLLLAETFANGTTAAGAWNTVAPACLTAGTGKTSSIAACKAAAPLDAAGSGALQLTSARYDHSMVVSTVPLSTANGLQIVFTDYSFQGTTPAGDGAAMFLSDASRPAPKTVGPYGGALGYSSQTVKGVVTPGIPNAYLGVGLDEYGNFSNGFEGFVGGPGLVPQTLAVRGAATSGYQYIGGYTVAGKPASLPFSLDQPTVATRPAHAPTFEITLTASGTLSAAIDRHDGKGFEAYYSQSIVGVKGQPAVPASVYLGFSAGAGADYIRHQIGNLTVNSLSGAAPKPTPTPTSAPTSAPSLTNPPELSSTNGALTFNVTAQADKTTGHPTFVYNGSATLPTLRLLPGDTLTVNLTNALPRPPANSSYTNDANLHYHGLHVSPLAPGDDSIDMIATPGQTLHYRVKLPTTHPPGLYWYHTHIHGETERDTLSGMSGALVVDGIERYSPQVANLPERIIIARDAPLPGKPLPAANKRQVLAMRWAMQHGAAMGDMGVMARASAVTTSTGASVPNPYVQVDPNFRRFVRASVTADGQCSQSAPQAPLYALTLSGKTQPTIGIRPGEKQFWRLVNAGADTYLDVTVDNAQLQIVALDGVPLSAGHNTPASMSVTHWVLPPGSRVEFVVTGPAAGTAALRTNCFDSGPSGNAMPAEVLGKLNPNASLTDLSKLRHVARSASTTAAYQYGARSAASLRASAVSNTRTIYYSDQYSINGAAYDPAGPPMYYVQSGTTEEWTIVNNSTQVHTFHIHQIHFLVEAIDGATQAQQYVMDNVNVPAATSAGPGTVKLLLDFSDPTIVGTFLFHCHILSHEDGGMMAKIRVGTAPPLKTTASQLQFASAQAAAQKVTIAGGKAPYTVSGCAGVAKASLSGGTLAVSPLAAGGCLLDVADASSPSLGASIIVNVAAAAATVKIAPASLAFASQYATSLNATISGGKLPYTAAGCTGVAAAKIVASTITVTPSSSGTCSVSVTDAAGHSASLSVSVNSSAAGEPLDNLTFHRNPARLGWYNDEVALNTTTVASKSFGLLGTLSAPSGMPAFGKVYAQPLFLTNQATADGKTHNLIIIATETDQIYAFDEATHAVVWHRDFTNAAAKVTPQSWKDSGCSDINPYVGITGTPVIDRTANRLYVVVATDESGTAFLRLHAVSLANGADAVTAVPVIGSVALATGGVATISPAYNNARGALLEANGSIYVTLGTHCDNHAGTTHGWILAYSRTNLQQVGSIADTTNALSASDGDHFLGSPWMGGYGPSADAQGNIYFATGNGPFDGKNNFGNSVMKLPGNLNMSALSYFAPATAAKDAIRDLDLGSGGLMILPDQKGSLPHLIVEGGKCDANGNCYKRVLDRDKLGGQTANDAGALAKINMGGGIWGGPAYFAEANGAQHIVYGGGIPLSTLDLNLSPLSLSIQSSANVGCLECRDHGSQPVVSSNGTQAGTAVVWALKTPGNSGGSISLYAFDALQMSHTLYHAVAGPWVQDPTALWNGGALVSPLVVDGRVYVPTENSVAIFGLH